MLAQRRLSVWPPLSPRPYLRRRSAAAPFPLDDPRCRLYGWGRQALVAGLRALRLGDGDEVLAPAYHHGSEIEALASTGLTCRFYEATDSLAPDESELERLLGPNVRALHVTHYLGFPQDAARWRRWCDERGLVLIEDAAQAWLARCGTAPAGSFGDVAIFCLYKSVGLPEGAAVIARQPVSDPGLDSRFGFTTLARRHAAWAAQRSRLVASTAAVVQRGAEEEYDPQEDFALKPHADQPWRCVPWLVRRFALGEVAARRRTNYSVLLDAFGDSVPLPFRALREGASPWAFPVGTSDKAGLLESLARRGVQGADFWSVPHPLLPAGEFPRAAELRRSTVCVPVHQELRPRDLRLISEARRESTPAGDPPPPAK